MKRKIIVLLVFATLSLVLMPLVYGNGIQVYVSKDKYEYAPGEKGTISIVLRNTGRDPIEVYNLTIEFTAWMKYTADGWDELGNDTIVYDEAIVVSSNKTVALEDISFTVPTDGRATDTNVELWIYTNLQQPLHPYPYAEQINVVPSYQRSILRAMDNIVVLLTVAAILAILSAIIIAAAVFLSARRPNVNWQKEA
ncbi:MAG: hypothetical protein NWE78_00840 [Candidatus Bathyarchaeota archaeon]|nr:hypothetical protein [Candidatus Bathyarchaeota archaeon]